MRIALIGYTGFIGGNLGKQIGFNDSYNSRNIENIKGKSYELMVSAGTKAERWRANQEPQKDWEGIKKLLDCLKEVKTKHFILISTIDVYPEKDGVDESALIDSKKLTQAYGKNRYKMEEFINNHFRKTTIIRCPQIYGPGLKKNFVYDLIHNNTLDFTHKDTLLQWYNVEHLWKDIQIAIKNNIPLINFSTEPISAKDLAKYALDMNFDNVTEKPPLLFNILTRYGKYYGSDDGYIYHRKETLNEIKDLILEEKGKLKQ